MLMMVALGAACTASEASGPELVTADSLAHLAPGERLAVDRESTSFDFSAAPIDWSRIDLVDHRGGTVAMDRLLAAPGAAPLLASSDRTFRVGTPPGEPLPSIIYCFEYMNPNGEVEWICVDI
jgi:hypothetical protein